MAEFSAMKGIQILKSCRFETRHRTDQSLQFRMRVENPPEAPNRRVGDFPKRVVKE